MINKEHAIFSHLPISQKSKRARWRLASEDFAPLVQQAESLLANNLVDLEKNPSVEILKKGRNRLCFRLRNASDSTQTVIVKAFPLKGLKNALYRYKRYALTEAGNLLHATDQGIAVPQVHAYGVFKPNMLVHCCAVMMEDLKGWSTLSELLQASPGDEDRIKLIAKTAPLFKTLYHAGCGNIDLSPYHIMFAPSSPSIRMIDLHYLRWTSIPSEKAWAITMGVFAERCTNYVSSDQVEKWFIQLMDCIGTKDKHATLEHFYKTFRTPLPRKALLRLVRA